MKWLAVVGLVAGCGSDATPEPPRCVLPGAYQLHLAIPDNPQRLAFTVTDPMPRFRPAKGWSATETRKAAEAWFQAEVAAADLTAVPALEIGPDVETSLDPDLARCTFKLGIGTKRAGVLAGWVELHLLVDNASGSVMGTLRSDDYGLERGVAVTGTRQLRAMP